MDTLTSRFSHLETIFNKACDQIRLFNRQLDDIQVRMDRATSNKQRAVIYSLRIRMAVMEGVRNMMCEYATRLADDLVKTQDQLVAMGHELLQYSSSSSGDDDDSDAEA